MINRCPWIIAGFAIDLKIWFSFGFTKSWHSHSVISVNCILWLWIYRLWWFFFMEYFSWTMNNSDFMLKLELETVWEMLWGTFSVRILIGFDTCTCAVKLRLFLSRCWVNYDRGNSRKSEGTVKSWNGFISHSFHSKPLEIHLCTATVRLSMMKAQSTCVTFHTLFYLASWNLLFLLLSRRGSERSL